MSLGRRTPLRRTNFRRAPHIPKTMVRGEPVGGTPFSEDVKIIVVRRSRGMCELPSCGRRATEFHHRLRRSQGGPGTPENCLHLCKPCHDHCHANPREAYETGTLIRRGQVISAFNAG